MCSRDDEDDHLMEPAPRILNDSKCRKCCESSASVLLQSRFPYCRDCFISMVSHKYRSTLGKSKLMKHGDRVLVGFSGSHSSISLLHLIKTAQEDGKKKKIKTDTVVLFVDDTLPSKVDDASRTEIMKEVRESLRPYEYDKYYSPLDSVFDEHPKVQPLSENVGDANQNIRSEQLLSNCRSTTSALDLLKKLRYHLLYVAAKELQCNKVFLAETSDHIATAILANVALGRGGQIPADVGFKDGRFQDVDFLRPLQECSKKEVTFYNTFHHLSPVTVPDLSTKASKYDNIQKLTEDFITNLGVTFPSTVHTVVATGSKLVTAEEKTVGVCGLCKGLVLDDADSVSSVKATYLSSQVSNLGPNGFDGKTLKALPNADCEQKCGEGSCCSKSKAPTEIFESLCYGCRSIVKDVEDPELLPKSMLHSIQQQSCFTAMHHQIKDFLIS